MLSYSANWKINLHKRNEILFLHLVSLKRSVGQGVKTPPFHGGITGSIPVRGTSVNPGFLPGFFVLTLTDTFNPAMSISYLVA